MTRFFEFWFNNTRNKILVLLILADICFIFLSIIHETFNFLNDANWSITKDRGFAEIFQYIKEAWIFIILFFCWIRSFTLLYFSWTFLFFYILIDDSLQIHERFGSKLASFFDFQPAFGLRSIDFGELIIYLVSFSLIILLLAISFYKSSLEERKISKNLFFLLAGLAFFGIFLDFLDVIVNYMEYHSITIFTETVEDGGEMLMISIITYYVLNLDPQNKIILRAN